LSSSHPRHTAVSEPLRFRRLGREDIGDAECLQCVLEAAPSYAPMVDGRPFALDAAVKMLSALPPGARREDKHSFAISRGSEDVGCADVVRGYPSDDCAHVGLLLFALAHQRRGFGRQAVAHIDGLAASWGCGRLRLTVVAGNTAGLIFWTRMGFREVERKRVDGYIAEVIVFERRVKSSPGSDGLSTPPR
jgi:diamine N-acetyltransferase